jgi:hypothetical protein
MNPKAPKLYGLIKTHKDNYPIRPVVSYINCPIRELSINLNKSFKNILNYKSKYSIKNSIDLINNLKNINISKNSKLVSFDVTSMFTNIPPKECLEIIKDMIDKSSSKNFITKSELLNGLKLCMSQNYFQFDSKYYIQKSGLPMGSPLSPLFSDIFMSTIEDKIMNSKFAKLNINFWFRYVDDILAGFIGTERQLNSFLEYINSLHEKIKFTLEIEKENKINFLDLTITKNENKLFFNIYRKPSYSDAIIPKESLHPRQHKLAFFNCMIHRAFSIPLSEKDLNNEINIIKNIAINNGFDIKLIDNLIKIKNTKNALKSIYPSIKSQDQNSYVTLTYFGEISEKIGYIISKSNKIVAYKTPNTISKILYNTKDKNSKFQKSGVYKLKCNECASIYIGQTGRNFEIRYKEHYNSFRLNKTDSTFSNHIIENNHTFPTLDKLKILHNEPKSEKLNLLESLEIYKNKNNNILNDQVDLIYSHLFKAFDT